MDKEEKYTISGEDARWIAEWAGRRLTGDECDTVRRMMKIAREMDGPDKEIQQKEKRQEKEGQEEQQ